MYLRALANNVTYPPYFDLPLFSRKKQDLLFKTPWGILCGKPLGPIFTHILFRDSKFHWPYWVWNCIKITDISGDTRI